MWIILSYIILIVAVYGAIELARRKLLPIFEHNPIGFIIGIVIALLIVNWISGNFQLDQLIAYLSLIMLVGYGFWMLMKLIIAITPRHH